MVPLHDVAGYRFAIEQLYMVSILCWVVAVWTWVRLRRPIPSFVALLLAMLLNPSLLLATPLVWVLDPESERRGRRSAVFAGASAAAFALTSVATRLFATGDEPDHPYDEFRIGHLPEGVRLVAGNIAGSVRDHLAVVVVVVVVAIVAASSRHLAPRSVAVYLAVPAFAFGWFLLFSTNGWVIQNLHEFRYFYPLYVTFIMYVAGAVTELVLATRGWRRSYESVIRSRAVVLGIETGLVVALVVVGGISIRHTDVSAIDVTREPVAAAHEHDVRLVAGNYWTTWPTVVAGRAAGLDLIGVSYRSDPIRDQIREVLHDADGTANVLCSGVDVGDCVDTVNDWSTSRWGDAEVVEEWPLVISIRRIG